MENICFTKGRSGFPEATTTVNTFVFPDGWEQWMKEKNQPIDAQLYVALATDNYQHFERWMTPEEVGEYNVGKFDSVFLGSNVPIDLK